MAIDWGQAAQIGGVGFGTVFLVLVILAIVLWLAGLVFSKIGAGTVDSTETKKGV